MKKIILLVCCMSALKQASAQEMEDLGLVQEIFGKEKKALAMDYMALRGDTAARFWPLYEEYENERKVLGQERMKIYINYADRYEEINDAAAARLERKILNSGLSYLTLQKNYFDRFSKITGAKLAAKFFQLESYIQNILKVTLQEEIPFINELSPAKSN